VGGCEGVLCVFIQTYIRYVLRGGGGGVWVGVGVGVLCIHTYIHTYTLTQVCAAGEDRGGGIGGTMVRR
jgi:hypothetical protein